MPSEFQIETEKPEDGIVVVSPVGEVDLASSPALRTRLIEIISETPKKLVLEKTIIIPRISRFRNSNFFASSFFSASAISLFSRSAQKRRKLDK